MSAIFNNASSVTQSHKLSVMTNTTVSGKRVSQRRGPYLYSFDVTVNPLSTSSTAYNDIRKEISSMDYGVSALNTTIPYLTKDNGSWVGSTNKGVRDAGVTGRTIVLKNFTASATDVIKDGDFIQFDGNTKVYQAIGDASADISGEVSVYLNTPLVESPGQNSVVTHGTAVTFSLVIEEPEFATGFSPRTINDNIASASQFKFVEVIL